MKLVTTEAQKHREDESERVYTLRHCPPDKSVKKIDRFENLDPEQEKVYAKKFFADIKAMLDK